MTVAAWIDGRFVDVVPELGSPTRVGLFETLGAASGELPLWGRHCARLQSAAPRLGLAVVVPGELRARARELLDGRGHRDGILRITLLPCADGGGSWCLTSRARERSSAPRRLQVVRFERPATDPTAGIKCTDRGFYDRALAEARAAGAEDALLVDDEGRVGETTTCNVFAELSDGTVVTPPLDGRILPGIARAVLLEGRLGRERVLTVADLDSAVAIWVTNAVYGPRRAVLPGLAPPGGRDLGAAWRSALAALHP